ncbi:ABC transporter ATP-binding protein [Pontibacter qinzhouensis]|uniref:ABC transporter ATP-binding protein n=1 Tax=Pontibacter qinzhouensis TaxID=2603253 RepID=A0A5C8KF99_9BACT|nr:ABC transporter ATP-binding protein [Pontibacter qinzhouensis]TXK52819.1 ABC transporter ATP-binding protein [Pontibacter qinzhouensis]
MKVNTLNKVVSLCSFLLVLSLVSVQAQRLDSLEAKFEAPANPGHDKVIKLHPVQLALGEIYLGYERARTQFVSNEIGFSYIHRIYLKDGDSHTSRDLPLNTHGVGIRMSQRHYTSKKGNAPFGFFHGPSFGYRFILFQDSSYEILGLPEPNQTDPDARYVGRLYLNTFDLTYQLGGQFKLSNHFTLEVAGGIGGRLKYAYARDADELLHDLFVGKEVLSDTNGAFLVTPLPQLKLSVGYSF